MKDREHAGVQTDADAQREHGQKREPAVAY
jgi:hypothetical protein